MGILFLSSCQSPKEEYRFLFVGHSYDWSNWRGNKIDSRLEKIKKSDFDGFWLGGDVCSNTTLNPKTLRYLDKQFDLRNPNSHFVMGNHDYRDNNLDAYFNATGRPDFYTSSFEGMVVSVLNTNLNSSNCKRLDEQYQMLQNVCDTISQASHYVLLMHHQIFENIDGLQGFKSNGVCKYYSMNCASADSYFDTTFYPHLVELEKKGIEVIVVMGDTGWHKGSEKISKDGVTFLASGINNSYYIGKETKVSDIQKDQVLIFTFNTKSQSLDYEFVELNELSNTNFEEWLSDVPK